MVSHNIFSVMQDQLQLFAPIAAVCDSRNQKVNTVAIPSYSQVNTLLAANVLGINMK